jgi:hypothetical protein
MQMASQPPPPVRGFSAVSQSGTPDKSTRGDPGGGGMAFLLTEEFSTEVVPMLHRHRRDKAHHHLTRVHRASWARTGPEMTTGPPSWPFATLKSARYPTSQRHHRSGPVRVDSGYTQSQSHRRGGAGTWSAPLHDAGIPTFAFIGPLLSHFATRLEMLGDLFGRLVDAGIGEVPMEHITSSATSASVRIRYSPTNRTRYRGVPPGPHQGTPRHRVRNRHRQRLAPGRRDRDSVPPPCTANVQWAMVDLAASRRSSRASA